MPWHPGIQGEVQMASGGVRRMSRASSSSAILASFRRLKTAAMALAHYFTSFLTFSPFFPLAFSCHGIYLWLLPTPTALVTGQCHTRQTPKWSCCCCCCCWLCLFVVPRLSNSAYFSCLLCCPHSSILPFLLPMELKFTSGIFAASHFSHFPQFLLMLVMEGRTNK